MDKLLAIISDMAPEAALSKVAALAGKLLADLDHPARERFLVHLIGQAEGDKVSGMVHL